MTYEEIMLQVQMVFQRVFQVENLEIREDMNANDVEEWDSLSHVTMLSEIQKHFAIKFKISEIMKFKNVGDMCKVIYTKLNS